MSEFPISCVLCRRKKIKCNKRKPCNQCVKKGTRCEFPEKFRNISISLEDGDELLPKSTEENSSSSNFPTGSSGSPFDLSKLNDEVELLRKEKLSVIHENFKLSQRNHELRSKLLAASRSENIDVPDDHGIEIAGETTELGRKYYGPQLSNYMIEALRLKKEEQNNEESNEKKDGQPTLPGRHNLRINSDDTETDDPEINLSKKPLPWVVDESEGSDRNIEVLKKLVKLFFRIPYYRCFISEVKMIDFICLHYAIKDAEWENDDDLLLLHMILILTLLRITPQEYNEMGISSSPVESVLELHKRIARLIKKTLYKGFTRLRHNLLNESIVTVQGYILCTEWYFVDQRYEESWSMMFHCCAVAYSIGLHVMSTMRTTNDYPEEAPIKLAEMANAEDGKDANDTVGTRSNDSSDEDNDEDYDVPRIKVWFALKNLSGQLCSILGRPNPISIQVNLVVLFTSATSSVVKMELEKKSTQVQLKTGLSECLRLSNMMLIEAFMMNFTMEDVMRLDNRFLKEAELLQWFTSDEYQSKASNRHDELNEWSHIPVYVERHNAVADLITLYINRAKLLEPFINQFVEGTESKYLLDSICESIDMFLNYICDFILYFLTEESPKFLNQEGKVGSKLRLGKAFRVKYPFVNSFVYQGVIVIFTLLNYKAKEFVLGAHNPFLELVVNKLNALMQFDSKISGIIDQEVHLWSTNIVYLINKDIQHINMLLAKAEEYKEKAIENKKDVDIEFEREMSDAFEINMKDPFWFTNPDNIPYYLSSPSDDGAGLMFDHGNGMEGIRKIPSQQPSVTLETINQQQNPYQHQHQQQQQQEQQQQQQQHQQQQQQQQQHQQQRQRQQPQSMFNRNTVQNFEQYNEGWSDPRQQTYESFQNNQMPMANQQGYMNVNNLGMDMSQQMQSQQMPPQQRMQPQQNMNPNQIPEQVQLFDNYGKMPEQMNGMPPQMQAMNEECKRNSASELEYAKSSSMSKGSYGSAPGIHKPK